MVIILRLPVCALLIHLVSILETAQRHNEISSTPNVSVMSVSCAPSNDIFALLLAKTAYCVRNQP